MVPQLEEGKSDLLKAYVAAHGDDGVAMKDYARKTLSKLETESDNEEDEEDKPDWVPTRTHHTHHAPHTTHPHTPRPYT